MEKQSGAYVVALVLISVSWFLKYLTHVFFDTSKIKSNKIVGNSENY